MNPALKPILAAIESAVVRIEYARDDEHAQREAEELLDNARTLLGILNKSVPAFTEADPGPDPYDVAERMATDRRSCETCAQHVPFEAASSMCAIIEQGQPEALAVGMWHGANRESAVARSLSRDCPGYTLRESAARITVGQ